MKHIKIEIVAKEPQQEELIALLDDHHATGFEQTDEILSAFFEEGDFRKDVMSGLLEGYSWSAVIMEEKNWNEEWEKTFKPVIVDGFAAVRAHFHAPDPTVLHDIIITPKMSFGTAHHATTYLMLRQMRELDFRGKTVFDFGTGTGILAIFAEKLGAEKITAIDVDQWSITNANENLERNGCTRIEVSLSSNIPRQRFDLVLANINRNVIIKYMSPLSAALRPDAFILISGLLIADEKETESVAAKCGLVLENKQEKEGWISLLFAKQG